MLELNQPEIFGTQATYFADVILPVPLPGTYTYRIPAELSKDAKIGSRVIVQFGKKKILTAIIANIHQTPPENYTAKYILELLDEHPIVNELQLKLLNWMADYYMCPLGLVLDTALPSGLKISSESKIQLNPDKALNIEELSPTELILVDALEEKKSLDYSEVSEITGKKSIYKLIKELVEKEVILIYEAVKDKYTPKKIKKIRLNEDITEEEQLQEVFNILGSKPKQLQVVMMYMQLAGYDFDGKLNNNGVEKKRLLEKGVSPSSVKTLVENGFLEEFEVIISRFEEIPVQEHHAKFSPAQERAKQEILTGFEQNKPVLLHGITGSGKTEIYIDLIRKTLEEGKQVLFLLPEIALSTQIVNRLRSVFGSTMGVYHSRYSDNERVETWRGVLDGKFPFVVGVRSSIFLPFSSLGLIIIDEEHEPSYKSFVTPRYQARDVAMMISHFHKANTLLGSATPSVESYYHSKTGKWALVELSERFGDAKLPNIEAVTLKAFGKSGKEAFSTELFGALENCLEKKEQAILLQNRRGYSPFLACDDCGHIPKCQNCNVSLTYHMRVHELKCHYCSHTEKVPHKCPACESKKIRTVGQGTEKIEDDLQIALPNARVQRMDQDTTKGKNSYQRIIDDFDKQRVDFLVGTQMVSKGLDFDKVNLVGVMDADGIIHFPDFRAQERAFQLITQVSGRAGRREQAGRVIIQTQDPSQKILERIIAHDYLGFFAEEINERKQFSYPPFTRLISITVRHQDQTLCLQIAEQLGKILSHDLGQQRILGPQEPMVNRIRNLFLMEILIKVEREGGPNLKFVKERIQIATDYLETHKGCKGVRFDINVDPN